MKTGTQTNNCTWMLITALFTTPQSWKQPKCPCTDKQNLVYPNNEILFGHMMQWSTDRCYNMDVPQKYYTSKINQKEKREHCMTPFILNIKKMSVRESESRLGVLGDEGRERWKATTKW